jgi:hypothetical protein
MQDLHKKSPISLITVSNEKELARYNIDEIARSLFGHDAFRMFPIYVIFYHGRLRGYLHAVQQTVIYPALHPDMMTTREFIRISRTLAKEIKRMAGNPLFMFCPKGLEIGPRALKAMKVKKSTDTAFTYNEEAR